MRLQSFGVQNFAPIRNFEIDNLDSVVVIAGANGSGKTRLKEALIQTFRNHNHPNVSMTLKATRDREMEAWGGHELTINPGQNSPPFAVYMNSRVSGGRYVGTAIHIDSDRSVAPIKWQPLNLSTPDPDEAETQLNYYLSPFKDRWKDIVNQIYQRTASRDVKIAQYAKTHGQSTCEEATTTHPDPFIIYQEVFSQLLPDKTLEPIDPKHPKEFHYKINEVGPLAFNTLSSGEQEIIKVAFDLLGKRIKHCIFFFDEPELHLHPTLVFKLIEFIKDMGEATNQLILFTHSVDLITTYYSTGNVFFIDPKTEDENQARPLSILEDAHNETAKIIGHNLGLFAVGKSLVFIEGENSSIDRAVYNKIARAYFPEAYVTPIGSVENILALRSIVEELENTVFGIRLYMIRDRDGLSDEVVLSLESSPRFRSLRKRHIENYFLDERVLSAVATHLYLGEEKSDVTNITRALVDIARDTINLAIISSIKEMLRLNGTVQLTRLRNAKELEFPALKEAILSSIETNHQQVIESLRRDNLDRLIEEDRDRLNVSLGDNTWKDIFPGKVVFNMFCAEFFGCKQSQVRDAYVDIALSSHQDVLVDIIGIFEHFNTTSRV